MNIQFELFEEITEEWLEEKRLQEIEGTLSRVRKGMFSRLHEQGKEIGKLHQKIDDLERGIEDLRKLLITRVK